MIEKEALDTWQSLLSNLPPISKDVRENIADAERIAQEDSSKYLNFWFSVLDEGLSLLITLQEIAEESFENSTEKPSPSFLFLLSRSCTLTIGVRQLLLNGLEDTARPVARSFLETLDLTLALITDDDLSSRFLGGDDADENHADAFWKNYISGGKLEPRIRKALQVANIGEETKNIIFEFRKSSKKTLSSSVHSSIDSAFRSFYVPSLASPGLLTKSVFGHVSILSPELLSFMIRAIYLYCFPILLLCRSENPPKAFAGKYSAEKDENASRIFLALDEIMRTYDHLFPPEFEFPEE